MFPSSITQWRFRIHTAARRNEPASSTPEPTTFHNQGTRVWVLTNAQPQTASPRAVRHGPERSQQSCQPHTMEHAQELAVPEHTVQWCARQRKQKDYALLAPTRRGRLPAGVAPRRGQGPGPLFLDVKGCEFRGTASGLVPPGSSVDPGLAAE